LLELLDAAVSGELEQSEVRWDPRPALCIVMASAGYPEKSTSGVPISGLPAADGAVSDHPDAVVFHAGTRRQGDQIVTAGGRVLGVTALGDTLNDARRRAYGLVDQIRFDGAQYRSDLGLLA